MNKFVCAILALLRNERYRVVLGLVSWSHAIAWRMWVPRLFFFCCLAVASGQTRQSKRRCTNKVYSCWSIHFRNSEHDVSSRLQVLLWHGAFKLRNWDSVGFSALFLQLCKGFIILHLSRSKTPKPLVTKKLKPFWPAQSPDPPSLSVPRQLQALTSAGDIAPDPALPQGLGVCSQVSKMPM